MFVILPILFTSVHGSFIELFGHSLQPPFEFESTLEDWTISGASVLHQDLVTLFPAIPDRYGFVVSRSEIVSSSFEVIVDLQVTGPARPASNDQGIGLWLLARNESAQIDKILASEIAQAAEPAQDWKSMFAKHDRKLLGMPSKFSGVGVFLYIKANGKAAISVVANEGQLSVTLGQGQATKEFEWRNLDKPLQLKLRVLPTSLEVQAKKQGTETWTSIGTIPISKKVLPEEGTYLAMSGYSGNPGLQADNVKVMQVSAFSFDMEHAGEKASFKRAEDLFMDSEEDEHEHTLKHIKRASAILDDYMHDMRPVDEDLASELIKLSARAKKTEDALEQLRLEVKYAFKTAGSGGVGNVQGLMHEIASLKSVLQHEDQKTLSKLQQHEDEKAKIDQLTEELEEAMSHTEGFVKVLVVLVILSIIGIGFSTWRRMNTYEKKHFL